MNTKTTHVKHTSIAAPKDKLMEDLRLVMTDAEELLRATANQAGEGADAARARIQDSLEVAREHLIATEEAVIERTRQAAKETDQYVHDNPWKAIGISALAGAIIGMLISRR
jgi:ElaB/YqjD/DUF883 family membrane-anchored ribosome-binding protein